MLEVGSLRSKESSLQVMAILDICCQYYEQFTWNDRIYLMLLQLWHLSSVSLLKGANFCPSHGTKQCVGASHFGYATTILPSEYSQTLKLQVYPWIKKKIIIKIIWHLAKSFPVRLLLSYADLAMDVSLAVSPVQKGYIWTKTHFLFYTML